MNTVFPHNFFKNEIDPTAFNINKNFWTMWQWKNAEIAKAYFCCNLQKFFLVI